MEICVQSQGPNECFPEVKIVDKIINYSRLYVIFSYCRGFHDVIPFDAISQFDEGGLELLLGGIGTINVKDWRDNTVYKNYQSSDTVRNFPR